MNTHNQSLKIQQALISVSDKSNLNELANTLVAQNIKILATGGTAKYLSEHKIPHQEIADYTKHPEILKGRVKTLHPKVFGGILAKNTQDDLTELNNNTIANIDLVIINLYPFEQQLTKFKNNEYSIEQLIEYIDIGGPSLLRAAAKNYHHKLVIHQPTDYAWVINKLKTNDITLEDRQHCAAKVFQHTAHYEKVIANLFASIAISKEYSTIPSSNLPESLNLSLIKQSDLRYGENPEQQSAVYYMDNKNTTNHGSLANPKLIQGKALSYNNLVDSNVAINIINDLKSLDELSQHYCCSIIKHASPCGVACSGTNITEAYYKAFHADNRSAFGGIIAISHQLTAELADSIINNQFVEVLIVPSASEDALNIISHKQNIRLIEYDYDQSYFNNAIEFKAIDGGLLLQSSLNSININSQFESVTNITLSVDDIQNLKFAWNTVKHVKSNAIVLAKNHQTIGIGGGQTSRIGSIEVAAHLAKTMQLDTNNCILASDAFFPFPDSIELAKNLGVKAIIQPGGSVQDQKVIEKANELDIAMVFTGKRTFCH